MAYQNRIVTSHGTLALEVRGEGKTPVLLILAILPFETYYTTNWKSRLRRGTA
jgi:hypothetical protein